MVVSEQQWTSVRRSLREAGERFGELVRAAPDPAVMATPDWTVADTAAHVAMVAWLYTTLLDTGGQPLPVPDLEARLGAITVDTVGEFNEVALATVGERDPVVLTDLLSTGVAEILRVTADRDPDEPLEWLGGACLPLAGALAHLLNEVVVHGHDIAKAIGVPWAVRAEDAALFFELFFLGMVGNGVGGLLDIDKPVLERRIVIEFRSAHTAPALVLLHRGQVSLAPPGTTAVDVRVRFEPATMVLVLFHRVSRVRAALTGKLSVRGRRPWLLFPFLRAVRLPDRHVADGA
ncbi:maleylpyruvate isomerase N-terminal domain-containing protein [Actinokineospora diospyrosa]|uniref:TIGR03083 family protein n=1 Tax=Actinokineospora diospyrosa TaxID=103728 RepID=A0ABT1IEB7_9PSEU|nr:maleylpyruvate isomerase N-terminal domain-containing protein [Actinokineospora diospyrosa]MCP2270980.1 TIGR03083 family protein [Actinokineospora diospyrosa]